MNYRAQDPLGITRVLRPKHVLPQQAEELDPSLPIAEDELLIDVESLNIDSASFKQMMDQVGEKNISEHILRTIQSRGKQHNSVTGSGGMLIGQVKEIGPKFPVRQKPVVVGDRIATLVSLTLTPLAVKRIKKIHFNIDRVDVEGHAILFATGIFAKLPTDLPEPVVLAALDVAGAPAQTERLVKPGHTVVVIGGGGKSGLLCLAQALKKEQVKLIAVEPSKTGVERLKRLGLAHEILQINAQDAVAVREAVYKITQGKGADLVINVANVPQTEMASILSVKPKGIVYFFSMATSFTQAALGAEGVGADVDLRIGNGYTEGHAELTLTLLRENKKLREFFIQTYGQS